MQIGLLRESTFCACRYIAKRLAKLGMRVVPVKEQVLQPRHLRAEYQKRYLEYEEVRYQVSDNGILKRQFRNVARFLGCLSTTDTVCALPEK